LRQAYDYWQDQPGNYLIHGMVVIPHTSRAQSSSTNQGRFFRQVNHLLGLDFPQERIHWAVRINESTRTSSTSLDCHLSRLKTNKLYRADIKTA
jgi:hypothetical protein